MAASKLNWSYDNDYFFKKSGLLKKIFGTGTQHLPRQTKPMKDIFTFENFVSSQKTNYETLYSSIIQVNGASKLPGSIAITSCYKGEGVSTVAANLVHTVAQHINGKVLLIDANLKKPSIHKIFSVNLSPGLGDVLMHDLDFRTAVQTTDIKDLYVLTAGKLGKDYTINFLSEAFLKLFKSIKQEYNFVAFDMPSFSETNSVVILGAQLDGVILLIETERVRWPAAVRVKDKLQQSKVNILGVVLNKKKFYIPRWLYKYI